jgi:probable F420-dependent oxidoreductase
LNASVPARAFRFGVNATTASLHTLQETARKAEDSGFSTLIIQDHLDDQLAPMPALVAAAAVTSRLRLATLVLDNDFRHPAVVAREAASVDVLSGGRMELGLGAGWLQADYVKAGIPLDPPSVRLARLAEAVQICKALFCQEQPVSFRGEHYQLQDLDPLPRPVQKPRPPIMVGGRQRRMLRLAAREADIVGISLLDRREAGQPPPPTFAQKVDWVRQAAGSRWTSLELHVNASVVDISLQPEVAVEPLAARGGQSIAEALASPAALVGSIDAIVDKLHASRENYGVSYWVVHARHMDTLAQVIARL